MSTPYATPRRWLVVLALLTVTSACGGGGGAGGGGPRVLAFSPSRVPSSVPTQAEVSGQGFGAAGQNVVVRFRADSGTPFLGGTQATVEVAGVTASDTAIHLTTPLVAACLAGEVGARVEVEAPGLGTAGADVLAVRFTPPQVTSLSGTALPTRASATLSILGEGFGPPGAPATVAFRAVAGTPFNGLAETSVTGVVVDEHEVRVGTPLATPSDFLADLTLRLGSGACAPAGSVTFARNLPPEVQVLAPAELGFLSGGVSGDVQLDLQVLVVDPEGDAATVALLNPQSGMDAPPLVDALGPSLLRVRWRVPSGSFGSPVLHFAARDAFDPSQRRLVSQRTRCRNGVDARFQQADVTGDGVADVVASAPLVDLGAATDAGAIYVWSRPAGLPTPTATLLHPAPYAGARLTSSSLRLEDVTGDGVADVLTSVEPAAAAGVPSGALCVWRGGAALSGTPAPAALLSVPAGAGAASLSYALVGDVTGDGAPEIVAVAMGLPDGFGNQGKILVWSGGAALSGAPAPLATLSVGESLGLGGLGSFVLEDVSGDGVLDVVAPVPSAWGNKGGIFVWTGGAALAGPRAPSARLAVVGAVGGDLLAQAHGRSKGLYLADVTGDGLRDVVALAQTARVGGVSGAGALHVWAGGAGLVGSPAPQATLVRPAPATNDWLGDCVGEGVLVGDVTGDGILDLVAGTAYADVGGIADAGLVLAWAGGGSLVGAPAPVAALSIPSPVVGDGLTGGGSGPGLLLADLTGDLVLDVVASASAADTGGAANRGAVYVWSGGAALTGAPAPVATCTVTDPTASANGLGDVGAAGGDGMLVEDVSGDGILDLVVGSAFSFGFVGGAFVWRGGAALAGAPAPTALLSDVPGAGGRGAGSWLLFGAGQTLQAGDVTADGIPDLVLSDARWGPTPTARAGAVRVFRGGAGLSGFQAPAASLTVPTAFANDELGGGQALQGVNLTDFDADGVLDVIAVATESTQWAELNVDYLEGPVSRFGATYLWRGRPGLAGTVAPDVDFHRGLPGRSGSRGQKGTGLLLGDVTGDGRPDLSLLAPEFSDGIGAVGVWTGGPDATGAPLRSVLLRPGHVQAGVRMGE